MVVTPLARIKIPRYQVEYAEVLNSAFFHTAAEAKKYARTKRIARVIDRETGREF